MKCYILNRKTLVTYLLLAIIPLSYSTSCTDQATVQEDILMAGMDNMHLEPLPSGREMMNNAGDLAGAELIAGHAGGGHEGGTPEQGGVIAGTDIQMPNCEIISVLSSNSCSNAGCHAPPIQGSLDLTSEDSLLSMLDRPSTTIGCEGRKLIDSRDPNRSIILQAIGATEAPLGNEDSCQIQMPPAGMMSEVDQQCFSDWVQFIAAQAETMPVVEDTNTSLESALRKLKTIMHGAELSQSEIEQAQSAGLKSLVESWTQTEAFDAKLMSFFTLSLQQKFEANSQNQFGRLRNHRSRRGLLELAMQEVIPRTAVNIVKTNQDFNQIATTRTWMMNTAALVALLYPDQSSAQRNTLHFVTGVDADAPNSLRNQIGQKRWYVEGLTGTCNIRQSELLEMFSGFLNNNRCNGLDRGFRFPNVHLEDRYFNDWRLVEIHSSGQTSDEELIPFYDIHTLRDAQSVTTRLPRVGFYTSNAFMNQWPSNVDNQFRVTVNQALISGLHISFTSSEPTEPIQMDALDAEHAEPGSECYGCHKQLDPMRVYFSAHYNTDYRYPTMEDPRLFDSPPRASFAFRGEVNDGGRVGRLGINIANHPRWSSAWIQKLCLFANSSRCDESDPLFTEIRERFTADKKFLPMLIDLFSSALITGMEDVESRDSALMISITRRDQLCDLLSQRLGQAELCELNSIKRVIGLIPQDSYSRGAVDFTQPALASPFFYAAAESVCETLATVLVRGANESFSFDEPFIAIENIIVTLMSIPSTSARYPQVLQALNNHYQSLIDSGENPREALRSVFTVACLSPDVMGVGL